MNEGVMSQIVQELGVIQHRLHSLQQLVAGETQRRKPGLPKKREAVRKSKRDWVPYQDFRDLLTNGTLSVLYDYSYHAARHGLIGGAIRESDVQTVWRGAGKVPFDIYEYARMVLPQLQKYAKQPHIDWTPDMDCTMVQSLMAHSGKSYQDTAYYLTQSFPAHFFRTAMIKGRFENTLRKMTVPQLRKRGLTNDQIAYIRG